MSASAGVACPLCGSASWTERYPPSGDAPRAADAYRCTSMDHGARPRVVACSGCGLHRVPGEEVSAGLERLTLGQRRQLALAILILLALALAAACTNPEVPQGFEGFLGCPRNTCSRLNAIQGGKHLFLRPVQFTDIFQDMENMMCTYPQAQ